MFVALLVAVSIGCAAPAVKWDMSSEALVPKPAQDPLAMMESTVLIQVDIKATLFRLDKDSRETNVEPIEEGWTGSGVVYQNDGTLSLILTANHVLETPKVGETVDFTINFFGVSIPIGKKRIDEVKISLKTVDGRICNLEPLVLGVDDHRDVATGVADCDAGRVAPIAKSVPARGEKIYISGHPLGVPLPIVTEGYFSGVMENYLLVSAGAYGGNSGGPVFYQGHVIGLLVRGSREYPNISLVTPLEQVLLRIQDTPGL